MLHIIRLASLKGYLSAGWDADLDLSRIEERISPGVGTYVLILYVARTKSLSIGSLGKHRLPPGYYAYVGSAFGPGGLRARLTHHLKAWSEPHWHIDYLRRQADITEIWFSSGPVKQEHAWARTCQSTPGVTIPAPYFGASDCQCASHLFFFPEPVRVKLLRRLDSGDLRDCG